MQTSIKNLANEIERLQKLNNYLYTAQKYKQEMLNKVLEENRKLSKEIENFKQKKPIIDDKFSITS